MSDIKDYLEFWQASHPVFIHWDGREGFYKSRTLQETVTRLLAYMRRTPSVHFIYGSPAMGKTTITRYCTTELSSHIWDVCWMSLATNIDHDQWVFPKLASFFGIHSGLSRKQKIYEVGRHLDLMVEDKRKLCIVVDSADRLTTDLAFGEIDTLLQLQDISKHCVSFVFVGRHKLYKMAQRQHSLQSRTGCLHEVDRWSYKDFSDFIGYAIHKQPKCTLDIPEQIRKEIYDQYQGQIGLMASTLENLCIESFIQQSKDILKVFQEQKQKILMPSNFAKIDSSTHQKSMNKVQSSVQMIQKEGSPDYDRDINSHQANESENIPLSSLFKKNA